jgi:hypothetical protein
MPNLFTMTDEKLYTGTLQEPNERQVKMHENCCGSGDKTGIYPG